MRWRPDGALRWDVLQLHLEEASFLWTAWEGALASPRHTLDEIADGPERRLLAHLDALATGGKRVAERLLVPALEAEEPEARTAAAFVLLSAGEGQRSPAVVEAFLRATTEDRAPLARAISVSDAPNAHTPLLASLASVDASQVAAVIDVLAFRQVPMGPVLPRLAVHPDPGVQAAALRAYRFAPAELRPTVVQGALLAPHAGLRHAALVAGLVAGARPALEACRSAMTGSDQVAATARLALAMNGDPADLTALVALLAIPALRPGTLWALGFSGRLAAAEACLPWLEDPTCGGLAAEALGAITGLAIEGAFLGAMPATEDEDEPPPLEDDLGRSLLLDPDGELPLADVGAVAAWWPEARGNLDPSVRYLRGKPFDLGPLLAELHHGPARRREALALELAIRSRGAVQVETRAFSGVQRRQLETASALRGGGAFVRPFSSWMSG